LWIEQQGRRERELLPHVCYWRYWKVCLYVTKCVVPTAENQGMNPTSSSVQTNPAWKVQDYVGAKPKFIGI
jgi:hypothetical protein